MPGRAGGKSKLTKAGEGMAIFKCATCGHEKEGRCKPQKCPECGERKTFEKKAS